MKKDFVGEKGPLGIPVSPECARKIWEELAKIDPDMGEREQKPRLWLDYALFTVVFWTVVFVTYWALN